MLSGEDIRLARQRAGLSQAELAERVGVSMRSIGNYERGETVPRNRLPRIEAALEQYLESGSGPTLASASDAEVLAEIARRFTRGSNDGTATRQARVSRADDGQDVTVDARVSDSDETETPDSTTGHSGSGTDVLSEEVRLAGERAARDVAQPSVQKDGEHAGRDQT